MQELEEKQLILNKQNNLFVSEGVITSGDDADREYEPPLEESIPDHPENQAAREFLKVIIFQINI